MIDVKTIEYDVELVTENETCYLLNDAILRLQWEEQRGELAQRVNMTVANLKTGSGYLLPLLKINCMILIYSKWNGGNKTKVFEGTVWEWQYASAKQRELTITAYDQLIRLQQSKDFRYYSAGMTTKAIISSLCDDWGIPLAYKWGKTITHKKKIFNGNRISDMIIGLLEEVRQKSGEKYVAYFRDGQLQIIGQGSNTTIYRFDDKNTISTSNKLTINNLVTKVKIIGKQDNDGRVPVDATMDGELKYGILQEIVRRDSDKTLETAKSEAETLLKDRGKPEENIQINVPDLPFIRRGDKIEMAAGNLTGFFFVDGVTHIANTRQMTLTLERVPLALSLSEPSTQSSDGKVFAKGDSIILNGSVYVDSHGNGKGRTFTDYHSTITIVAPLDRKCPYHIGAIGWVLPEEIRRA